MKSGNRNLIYIVAGIVIVVLVLLVVMLLGDNEGPWDDQDAVNQQRNDPTQPTIGEDGQTQVVGVTPEERLEYYQQWAKYPPHSRPLHEGNVDLIDPYNAKKTPLGVVSKPGKNCTFEPSGSYRCEENPEFSDIKCEIIPESSISVGKKDFHVSLYCNNEQGKKQELSGLTSKFEKWFNRKITSSLPPIHMGDDGTNGDATAGDFIYTITVRPGARDWGQMLVTADFEVGGLKHSQRAEFFSTPHIVAEFKSGVRETLNEGNLIINVPIVVTKPGTYEIQANLQEAGGDKRFIAHSTFDGELKAGSQVVQLEFFGKLIKDAGVDGPYTVREIRGKRHNSPMSKSMLSAAEAGGDLKPVNTTEPLWEYISPYAKTYQTQDYKSSDFSDKEYDSAEKQRRIKNLQSQ